MGTLAKHAEAIVEQLKKLGDNYRPPRRQGVYWDAVDLIERLQAELKRTRVQLRNFRQAEKNFFY